jgi:hypothetical protein
VLLWIQVLVLIAICGQQAKLPTIIIQTVGPYSVTATQGHGSSSYPSTKISAFASNVATIAKVEVQDG